MEKRDPRWKGNYSHAISAEDYLAQRCVTSGACVLWTAGKDKNGYGQCHAAKHAKELGVSRAHQLAYVVAWGKIPEGKIICHTCDNPSCINPHHLYAGTHQDNVDDCVKRGRTRNGAKSRVNYSEVVAYKGEIPCTKVAEIFGISYSRVCQIWRDHGENAAK